MSLAAVRLVNSALIRPQAGWWFLADGVILLPETDAAQIPEGKLVAKGLRQITMKAPWACAELQAAATFALAEVGVPFLVVSGASTFNLFVYEEKISRAMAALRQARLERFTESQKAVTRPNDRRF